jgi:hypothetical protein
MASIISWHFIGVAASTRTLAAALRALIFCGSLPR